MTEIQTENQAIDRRQPKFKWVNRKNKYHVEIKNFDGSKCVVGDFYSMQHIANALTKAYGYKITDENIRDMMRGKSKKRSFEIIITSLRA